MTDESYAEDRLRASLGALLVDEPPSPSVVDDVARGLAARRRRRTGAAAGLGLVLAAVATLAVTGALRPESTVQPADGAPPASVEARAPLDVVRLRLLPVLASAGWTVVSEQRPTATGRAEGEQVDLGLVRTTETGLDDPTTAEVRVVVYPVAPARGYYLSDCTEQTCASVPTVADDCATAVDCATTTGALPRGSTGRLDWGSLILDRTFRYPGSGAMVELVVGADRATPAVAAPGPGPVLDLAASRDLLDAIGNPYDRTPGPSTDWATRLAGLGWHLERVVQDATAGSGVDGRTVTDHVLRHVDGRSTLVRITTGAAAGGLVLARCTATTCPGSRYMSIADGVTPTSGHTDEGAQVVAVAGITPHSYVLQRTRGDGRVIEVLVSPAVRDGVAESVPALAADQVAPVMDAVDRKLRD